MRLIGTRYRAFIPFYPSAGTSLYPLPPPEQKEHYQRQASHHCPHTRHPLHFLVAIHPRSQPFITPPAYSLQPS